MGKGGSGTTAVVSNRTVELSPTGTTSASRHTSVTLKLPQLQNLCKRDPVGYKSDYDAQIRRLQSEIGILSLSPSETTPSPELVNLIQFAAAVSSSSYKGEESDGIADLLIGLLAGSDNGTSVSSSISNGKRSSQTVVSMSLSAAALNLHRDVRKSAVSALILMRNKGAVEPLRLLELFYRLMSVVPDKSLRESLYKHIVNDIRNINKKGKRDEKVNRSVQAFLHRVISSSSSSASSPSDVDHHEGGNEESANDVAAKRGVDMVCELYRRNVWTDERTVSILASAVESSNPYVMCRAIRFFLNIEEKMAEDVRREEEDEWNGVNEINLHKHSRKTQARKRQVLKQVKNRKRAQLKRENSSKLQSEATGTTLDNRTIEQSKKLYPAIELLHDPQGLAESVFRKLRSGSNNKRTHKFETKLLMINFLTRLVGNHELLLLPLYPFLRRYMGGHQRDVTAILAYSVQACHEYVPPEEVHGILKTIAYNFVTERCSGEQMAVGINACRAICARVPSVLSEEDGKGSTADEEGASGSAGSGVVMDVEAFVRDLAAYSKHRDRSVSIAGRGFANFVREVHPGLLAGKDRGSTGSALHRSGEKPLRYGEQKVASGVRGADLLVEYEAKREEYRRKKKEQGGGDSESSDDDSDSDSDDGIKEERMNDEESEEVDSDDVSGEWIDVEHEDDTKKEKSEGDGDGDDDNEEGAAEAAADDDSDDDDDEVAPTLVSVKEVNGEMVPENKPSSSAEEGEGATTTLNLSKLSTEERSKLQQQISSTRVFTTSDFVKMRKLVEREEKARRDPRAAARRKRALAKGKGFEKLSDDDGSGSDDSDSDEDEIRIAGAVNPSDIEALARRKRTSKAEKLEKIIAGRAKFESKARDGGSTNTEKKRRKNFVMSKFSHEARKKRTQKETSRNAKRRHGMANSRDSKKRRRKV